MTIDSSIEETDIFTPKWTADGLIPAIVQDAEKGDVLMMAWMSEDSLAKTLETGETWFWSRSRKTLWHKGGTSGNVQRVRRIVVDCDQDCLLIFVEQCGEAVACHTGRRSCFYRVLEKDGKNLLKI